MEELKVIQIDQHIDPSKIKHDDLRGLARSVLNGAAAAMQSPEVMKDFERWQRERRAATC